MTTQQLQSAVISLAEEAKGVDPATAAVLFTLAADLSFNGAGALANLCDEHSRESLSRIQQIFRG